MATPSKVGSPQVSSDNLFGSKWRPFRSTAQLRGSGSISSVCTWRSVDVDRSRKHKYKINKQTHDSIHSCCSIASVSGRYYRPVTSSVERSVDGVWAERGRGAAPTRAAHTAPGAVPLPRHRDAVKVPRTLRSGWNSMMCIWKLHFLLPSNSDIAIESPTLIYLRCEQTGQRDTGAQWYGDRHARNAQRHLTWGAEV